MEPQDNDQSEQDVLSTSEEEEHRVLESSGLCIVNRACQGGWLHTPLTPSMQPPVAHIVTVTPSESAHIYNEINTVIKRREQIESLPVIHSDSEFEDISLKTTPSASTVYKLCDRVCDRVCDTNVQNKTPLLTQDTERDSKDKEINGSHNHTVIKVREIVGTVIIISGSLFLLSTLMALQSL